MKGIPNTARSYMIACRCRPPDSETPAHRAEVTGSLIGIEVCEPSLIPDQFATSLTETIVAVDLRLL